jgi:uncharacterized membrane protein YccC
MQNSGIIWLNRYRAQLRLAVRITVASLVAFALCHLLGLAQSYPAVLTAVIVMQSSVGASLQATLDRLLGTLGGAAWGLAALFVLPPSGTLGLGITLTAALAPLALVAALKPAYRVAPITAVILLLTKSNAGSPIAQAIQRVLEIGLGGIVAMVVALVVLPARAHEGLANAAGRAVAKMGDLAAIVMNGLTGHADADAIQRLHDDIRVALGQAEAAGDEAARERATYLSGGPDSQPALGTLRRIRNDLAAVGRAAAEPLPEPLRMVLAESASSAAAAIATFLHTSGEAITSQKPSPSLAEGDAALAQFTSTVAEVRREGLTRELPDETAGRVFGLAFALEQLHQNLRDLVDRTNDLARRP